MSERKYFRRLPLENMSNARELGGYRTPEGITRYGVFLRTERPCGLTENDLNYFKKYGLKRSIDFRSEMETKRLPSDLANAEWLEYINMPIFVEAATRNAVFRDKVSTGAFTKIMTWGEVYIAMTDENKDWLRESLELAADCDAVVQFNCSTGKDRTGVFAAILLGIAGVADEDIVADYCVSQIYLRHLYKELASIFQGDDHHVEYSEAFFRTDPENMMILLEYINKTFGGILNYVRSIGVSEEMTNKIREKFIEKID